MIKLLHIGVNAGSDSMPKYFREQCDYKELQLNGDLKENINSLISNLYMPDIVFIQIQSDKINGVDVCTYIGKEIRYFKNNGAYVINWTGDKRSGIPKWMIDFHNYVNITGFSNEEDRNEALKYGMETIFLQQGIDTDIFKSDGSTINCPEIVFLANNYGNQFPLSIYRKDVVRTLANKFGRRFGVYGNGWTNAQGNVNSNQYEEAEIYRSCKIAVSVSHFNSDRYFSDRLGRALCSGAFVLSHNYNGITKDFEIGKHLEVFGSVNDLVSKCSYWMDNEERKNIAKQGCELARREFSYKEIVKQILSLHGN